MTTEPGGDTRVTGSVTDQSMLLGLLQLFSDLGHEVISVNPVDDGPTKEK
ncbi:hypothetical protein JOD63_003106 [Microbacterium terrae]|nr:hypothetical protein [Microbacterium terrae]MBP1079138.1 hypothetical protein [Microbacterium terrae]